MDRPRAGARPVARDRHPALSLALKQPYINLLMREPTARFIELTHDRYAKELGADLKVFTSTFTDEPSLMSSWLRQMPYYVLPWCPDLPADYRARTGRDLLADVPAITFENASGTTPRLRYDFWNLVGDRVSQNFMGQLTEWATKHGILSEHSVHRAVDHGAVRRQRGRAQRQPLRDVRGVRPQPEVAPSGRHASRLPGERGRDHRLAQPPRVGRCEHVHELLP